MSILFRNYVLMIAMLLSMVLATIMKPTEKMVNHQEKFDLESMIPKKFDDWYEVNVGAMLVSPDTKLAIDKIYNQVLSRTYVNNQGYKIMLSIAYGDNQSEEFASHDPEGCYPAQGFQILSKQRDVIHTVYGDIPIKKMETENGSRHEIVSYWAVVGEYAVNNDLDRKKAQIGYALKREIPDGMLFRISSIEMDTLHAYSVQEQFITELLKYIPATSRQRLGVNLSK